MSAAKVSSAKIAQSITAVTPRTTTIDLDSGSGRRLGVCLMGINNFTGVSISVGSTVVDTAFALQSGTHVNRAGLTAEWWVGAISDGNTGVQTITVTWGSGNGTMAAHCICVVGSDANTNGANANNAASPLTLPMTSVAGDLTVSGINEDGFGATTMNFTRDQSDAGPSTIMAIGHGSGGTDGNGDASPTHIWTKGSGDWANAVVSGVNFRAAPDVSQPPMSREQQNMIVRERWLRQFGY